MGDKMIWEPSPGSVLRAVHLFRHHVQDVAVAEGTVDGPDPRIDPVALMPDLHILPGFWTVNIGYDAILAWLEQRFGLIRVSDGGPPGNLFPFPYDWRLSNRYNGQRLLDQVTPVLERWRAQPGQADSRLVLICHSMGGLVARWFLQECGGAEITRKLITLGTPNRGALSALEQLVNGVRKGPWPFRVDLTSFARSLPSAYQLLPQYLCVESDKGLQPVTGVALPHEVDARLVADAAAFHAKLDAEPLPWSSTHVLTGREQRTTTTARFEGDGITPLWTIDGEDEGGDGTVPTVGSVPHGEAPDSPGIFFVAEQHGALQSNQGVFDQIHGILTARHVPRRAGPETALDVTVPEVLDPGDPLPVRARLAGDWAPIDATVIDETGAERARERLTSRDGEMGATFTDLAPGAYVVRVHGAGAEAAARVGAVSSAVLIWDEH
jgi:hypothetical protein